MPANRTKELYEDGVKHRDNTLQSYDFFLENLGLESLEEFIDHKFPEGRQVNVLDIGCGNAGALGELKAKLGKRVHCMGLDFVDFQAGVDEKIIGNALEIELPKADFIISFRALHEIGHVKEMLQKIAQALLAQGKAVLSIRAMALVNGKLELEESMRHEDVQYLKELAVREKLGNTILQGCRVHVELISQRVQVENPETHAMETMHFLHGATVLLEKG